jgi:FHS family L-fucose permease-like MFS transporter
LHKLSNYKNFINFVAVQKTQSLNKLKIMAILSQTNEELKVSSEVEQNQNFKIPLIILTSLFFMWGFITCLNDILIPHLKSAFKLSYAQAALIQVCFFGAYFVISWVYFLSSITFGDLLNKIGYKNGIILGLAVAGIGCFMFSLFILASGITILQISANPYVAILGPPETASSRLSLTQAFNSLGTFIAPYFGQKLILSPSIDTERLDEFTPYELELYLSEEAKSVEVPYLGLGLALFFLALMIFYAKLPKITSTNNSDSNEEKFTFSLVLKKYPHLIFGAVAIFMYVGGEVAIGSYIVNFLGEKHIKGLIEKDAAGYLPMYWGGAMVGRFLGAALMTKFKPSNILAICTISVCFLLSITINFSGDLAMYTVLGIGLFNSIMFPVIFTLSIDGLGIHTSRASSILVMMIVGGAVIPFIQGNLADIKSIGIQKSFLVPLVCYLYLVFFALKGYKKKHLSGVQ